MEHIQKFTPTKGYQYPINKKPFWAYLVYIMQCSMVLIFKCLSQKHMTLQQVCFVSMNVLMVPMIITMTQIMQDLSNEDVHLPFQSNNCTQPNVVELCFYTHT
jgi:hypothetical protein